MCQQAACQGAASHGGDHEAGKDHAMGQMLAIWTECWGPQENKGVHAAFKQGLHGAKQADSGICNSKDECVSRRAGHPAGKNVWSGDVHVKIVLCCALQTKMDRGSKPMKQRRQLVYNIALHARQVQELKTKEQKAHRQQTPGHVPSRLTGSSITCCMKCY